MADDANTDSRGLLGCRRDQPAARLGAARSGACISAPFLGVNNLWDRRYVGSVTLNGLGGRVFEPAPRRIIYFGAEIGYRALAGR